MGNSDSPKKMEKRGKSAFQRGDYLAAAKEFEAARQVYAEAGDAVMAAEMANNCSVAYLQADEPEKALQAAEGTADVFADAGDQVKQGMAVGNCAAALEELGQTDEAIEAYLLSAELLEDSGEDQLRANVMQALSQLQFQEIEEHDRPIVLYVVGNLDKDGYLCCSAEEIGSACDCCCEDVERVLRIVHSLEPAGVGARNLGECLLIQLEHLGLGETLAATIVKSHLGKLERKKYDQIAREENVDLQDVYSAVITIQNLEPRPGRPG